MTFRLALGGLAHETNQYVAAPTRLDDFTVTRGQDILAARGVRTYAGGMLDAAAELGATVVGTLHAIAMPSGVIETATYRALKQELLDRLATALPVDAVALDLHGAGVVDGLDDLEGDLTTAVRTQVGREVPIVVTHDLHGHITAQEAAAVDAMFGVHHYPHDDMYERGREAVEAIPDILGRRCRPVVHVERLPMLVPTTTTYSGVGAEVLELCQRLEKRPGILDVTFMHGFPYTDNPHVGCQVVAIADGDPALAAGVAREAAEAIWQLRERFLVCYPPPAEALSAALAADGEPIVINETSDNPGGGAPGDGTHLLRAVLAARPERTVFCGLTDPAAVQAAHRAGVGATLALSLGGKTDDRHGEPIDCQAYVKALTDGSIVLEAPMGRGWHLSLGPTALLVVDGVEVILFSRAMQTIDRTPLVLHGIDPTRRKVVALKSSQHFRSGFTEIAAGVVSTDSPGLTTMRLNLLERTRTPRPVFPLDPEAVYRP